MAKLKWSEESLLDMEDIYDYIARDSFFYGKHQLERIYKSVEQLSIFPNSGRHLPEFQYLPYREIIVGSYRVIYRYESKSDQVIIISIVHGRRLLTAEMLR